MAISTFAELKTAVANWLNRTDLTSRIPEFIAIGESHIAADVRCRLNEKRITASISTEFFDIPSNFLEMRNFQLDTDPVQHLNYYTPEQIDLYHRVSTSFTGQPFIYTIHGQEFQVYPGPDTTYTAQMTYWYRLTAFSADNDTNSLLTTYPNIYLYAALKAAIPFLEKGAPDYEGLYAQMVKKVNRTDKTGRFSGTAVYSKPRQIPE